MKRAAALALIALVAATGCRSALRDAPTLQAMIERHGGSVAGDADSLRSEARRSFAEGTIDGVEAAVGRWLSLAAIERDAAEPLAEASRGQVWLSDRIEAEEARRTWATAAVQSAQLCQARDPEEALCEYRLAVALGAQARERRSTGLDALPTMVELLERAVEAIPSVDEAGPERVLALVYLRAPGWPTGPGDPELGLDYAERAVARAPDHPANQLALGEAWQALDEPESAAEAFRRALELAETSRHPDRSRWIATASGALAGR